MSNLTPEQQAHRDAAGHQHAFTEWVAEPAGIIAEHRRRVCTKCGLVTFEVAEGHRRRISYVTRDAFWFTNRPACL